MYLGHESCYFKLTLVASSCHCYTCRLLSLLPPEVIICDVNSCMFIADVAADSVLVPSKLIFANKMSRCLGSKLFFRENQRFTGSLTLHPCSGHRVLTEDEVVSVNISTQLEVFTTTYECLPSCTNLETHLEEHILPLRWHHVLSLLLQWRTIFRWGGFVCSSGDNSTTTSFVESVQ